MTVPTVTVQADLSGTAMGGTFVPTDISTFVLTTGEGSPISITLGRQDQTSDVVPSTCSFVLINDDGRFTPDRSSSPYYPHVLPGVRVRVSVTVGGTTYNRFDGYVESWEQVWESPAGTSGLVRVSCSDILARFGTPFPLVSEEMLIDSPVALYPLTESVGSASAGSIAKTASAALVPVRSKNGGGDYSFGTGAGLTGNPGGASLQLNSTLTTAAADDFKGYFLAGAAPSMSGAFTFEAWVEINATLLTALDRNLPGTSANPVPVIGFLAPSGYLLGALGLFGSGNAGFPIVPSFTFAEPSGAILAPSSWAGNLNDGQVHHIAFTSNGTNYAFYVDGVSVASGGAGASPLPSTAGSTLVIGGRPVNGTFTASNFRGDIQFAAVYNTALSAARIAAHYAGGAVPVESTTARVTRLLAYRANTGSSIAAGSGTAGAVDLSTATLQQALLETAVVEGGYLYVNGSGQVVLLNRNTQYNPASALTLDSSLAQVQADTTFRIDTQQLANDVTITRPDGAAQRATDVTSYAAYGDRPVSLAAPFASDADALEAAYWTLANRKDAKVRAPGLTVDLLNEPTTGVVQACLALTPWKRVTVTNLPSTAPAATVDVIVQGWTETLSVDLWSISYYTSRLPLNVVIADGVGTADGPYVAAW